MAANIFGVNDQLLNGSFRADKTEMTFGGQPAKGLLLQNVQFSFTQQVTVLYEIGSAYLYYVGGRAQGTASIARIIGPAPAQFTLVQMYGDVCQTKDIQLKANSGCLGGGSGTFTLKNAVLTTLAVSVTAQDIVIHQQLQFMFANLEVAN